MFSNPTEIYQKVISSELSKVEAARKLLYLIEESIDESLRVKSIEIIKKLELKSEKIYRILEHSLISDESRSIRIEAAITIFNNFLDIGIESLKYVIQYDNSSMLLSLINDLIKNFDEQNNPKIEELSKTYSKRLKNISLMHGVVYEEVQFLIDMNIDIDKIKLYKLDFELDFLHKNNLTCVIKDKHIIAVNISLKDSLPVSIGTLLELELLDLSCNNLTVLPDSLTRLHHLKTLDLSWNNLRHIPEQISQHKTLEFLNLSNNDIQKIPESISSLRSIVKLDLRNNSIQEIPKSIIGQKQNSKILI